ncbi:jg16442 [Pararge aegeria aegeria]|uniref:Jg16442 protein n=1 Tax=Pararge aegeria aegeria TaxID=348720 RepID=A0A8S4SJG4_9NEOP|nr:jg16442 [Pararge aegeria aegeria]
MARLNTHIFLEGELIITTLSRRVGDRSSWSSSEDAVARRDLSPAAVIATMLAEDKAWKAVVFFCETVLVKKEAAERDRERSQSRAEKTVLKSWC